MLLWLEHHFVLASVLDFKAAFLTLLQLVNMFLFTFSYVNVWQIELYPPIIQLNLWWRDQMKMWKSKRGAEEEADIRGRRCSSIIILKFISEEVLIQTRHSEPPGTAVLKPASCAVWVKSRFFFIFTHLMSQQKYNNNTNRTSSVTLELDCGSALNAVCGSLLFLCSLTGRQRCVYFRTFCRRDNQQHVPHVYYIQCL